MSLKHLLPALIIFAVFCGTAEGQDYEQEKTDPDILYVKNINFILTIDSLSVLIRDELEKAEHYFRTYDSLTTLAEAETDSVKYGIISAALDSLSLDAEDNFLLLQELQTGLSDAVESSGLSDEDLLEFSPHYRMMNLKMALLGLDILGQVTMQEKTKTGSSPGRAANRDDNAAKPDKDELFKLLSEKAKAEPTGEGVADGKKGKVDLNSSSLAKAADYLKAEKLILAGGRLLKEEDVAALDNQDAKNLIMTILAAKGKIFRDTVYQEFFTAKKWYKPVKETVYNILKKDDIMNIRFLSVNFEIEY